MGDKIAVSDEGLRLIKHQILLAAADLGEVANGAYVTGTLFTESKSQLATAMDETLAELSTAATSMYALLQQTAAYFGTVIAKLDQWDFEQAVASYHLGEESTGYNPANVPPRPEGTDLDAWGYGRRQGYAGRSPN